MNQPVRTMNVIACGAGPATDIGRLILSAQRRDWAVQVILTPAALPFLDTSVLETMTGFPVRSTYRLPGQPRSSKADAVIVAPASYNTINKCAQGISDTYALGILAEAVSLPIPVVMLPFVNTALASRRPFLWAVDQLRAEGVRILLGPGEIEPHLPGTGDGQLDNFPWDLALEETERLTYGR